MTNDTDLQQRVQRISGLVHEIDSWGDPGLRASSKELVQLLLDLHSAGLERILETIARRDDLGMRIIDDLGRDPLVSSLLVLYGLHPFDLETRVARSIEEIAPRVRKGGGEVRLIKVEDGIVRVEVVVTAHSCGSTAKTLKSMVEDAIYGGAPDLAALVIEGLDEPTSSSGFVPLAKLGATGSSIGVGEP